MPGLKPQSAWTHSGCSSLTYNACDFFPVLLFVLCACVLVVFGISFKDSMISDALCYILNIFASVVVEARLRYRERCVYVCCGQISGFHRLFLRFSVCVCLCVCVRARSGP